MSGLRPWKRQLLRLSRAATILILNPGSFALIHKLVSPKSKFPLNPITFDRRIACPLHRRPLMLN
jgi:hypothetical protein